VGLIVRTLCEGNPDRYRAVFFKTR
jgi:hypothetical protein